MKKICSLSFAMFLGACGVMEAPKDQSSSDGSKAAALLEATGDSQSYDTLAAALPDETVEIMGCGTSASSCAAGAHPEFYFCDPGCPGAPCTSSWNAASCEPDVDTFPMCGTTCPTGWYQQSHDRQDLCSTSTSPNGTLSNRTVCVPALDRSITTCVHGTLECPNGYLETSRIFLAQCNISPTNTLNNARVCQRPTVALSFSVSSPSISAGDTATGTILLDAPAPAFGVPVTLSSNSPRVTMPATVTVAPGAVTRTFSITASNITARTPVSITATLDGLSQSAPLTLLPPPPVSALTLATDTATAGDTVSAQVTLADMAPDGGTVVTLSSSNPAAQPSQPTVEVAEGSTTATFNVSTSAVASSTAAIISASSNDDVTVSATLIVLPASPSTGTDAIHQDAGCQANTLPRNDDGSTGAVALPFQVNFFGTTYTHLFVNNNGNVTFQAPLGTFTPFRLTANTPPIIAAFFADVDTRSAGSDVVRYSFGSAQFNNRAAFCAEWINVGYYNNHADKLNSFQLLLVDRSDQAPGDFDIVMNYRGILWETGDASGGSNGFGGVSAGAGYSAGTGQVEAFYEFPGSLENGALLDSNTSTGLTQTSRNSLVRGRHVFEVRNGSAPVGGSIAGDVTGGATPLANAPVQVCPAAGGQCLFLTQTGAAGRYLATGLPAGDYLVTAFPPAGSFVQQRTVGPVSLAAGQTIEVDVTLEGLSGLPAGGSLTPSRSGPSGVPSVHYRDPLDLEIPGCLGGIASYSVTQGISTVVSGAMLESPAGRYVAQIPPLYPRTGPARITVTIQCPDGTTQDIAFDIYIDPSGVVRTLSGVPVRDAVVTLYRSDSPTGPFEQVPDGSAIMSPSNRDNPDQTDAAGFFRWDVISGYYVVRAQKEGCTSPTGGPFFETEVLPVPPPAIDLDLWLDCPELEDTARPVSTVSVSPAPNPSGSYNGPVTVQITATDEGSGVEEIGYMLSGAHADSALVAGEQAVLSLDAEGSTTLTWFARDRAGNVEALQSLEIEITSGPALAGCDDVTALATPGLGGALVSYEVTASDDVDGSVPVACDPAPGSFFAMGESRPVTCTAADSEGNQATCTFLVQVDEPATCEAAAPREQDYWRSQCNYRGPDGTPPDPVLTSEILQHLLDRAEPGVQAVCEPSESTCQALNPDPFWDVCEQACQQYAGLLLNVASARVPSACCTNDGTAAESAALVADLIAAGQCAEASLIAYDVNRGCVFSCSEP
jgi:Nidogen-like/HYR domain